MRSLLLDGERKSIEPLATRLPEGNVQAMQQFIGQSPWEWNPIWERLGKRMTAELEPSGLVVDDTGFPKQGTHSVAAERQYSGTLGKTGNCQIAVSVHHVGEQGNVPLGWRLYLPESWANDAQRRREAGIPEGIVFRKKWNWRWKSSIRSEGGVCRIEWCWEMPATEMAPNSAKNWKSGNCNTPWVCCHKSECG